jgi:hypothetical protein
VFSDEERTLLRTCAGALNVEVDVDALAPATPDTAAPLFREAPWSNRLIQVLLTTAMIDGELTKEETALLDAYGRALGVESVWLKTAHHIVDGHLMRMRIDIMRRNPLAKETIATIYEEEGLRGIWRFFKTARGKGEVDHDFKQLGLLPEGTFGREFWEHMTERRFAFPGEPGAIIQLRGAHHDLTHVLTGYDTDPAGECQIAAFYSGYKGDDPFAFVFFTIVMFQLGIAINPGIVTASKLAWDPPKVLAAMQRGSRINTDLTDHWDFWPDLPLPIDEVRSKYNIL